MERQRQLKRQTPVTQKNEKRQKSSLTQTWRREGDVSKMRMEREKERESVSHSMHSQAIPCNPV